MLEVALAIPFWLELIASLTGGLSGAMCAIRAKYDIFGVVCIAIITGLAGGILRDVLLQNYGIYAFQQPSLIIGCAAAGVVGFFFSKLVTYLDPIVDLLDNLSVGLWAIIGVGKGLSAGLDIVPSIIMGTITAVGGGIIRDICMNKQPEAFKAGTLYGSAALIGSAAYTFLHQNHILDDSAGILCVALILGIRYASIGFGWETKEPHDYSDAVVRPVKSVARLVIPPASKTERDRAKNAKKRTLRPFSWMPQKPKEIPLGQQVETGTPFKQTNQQTGSTTLSNLSQQVRDPSDRIVVNRAEFQQILEETRTQDLFTNQDPIDPFEPRS